MLDLCNNALLECSDEQFGKRVVLDLDMLKQVDHESADAERYTNALQGRQTVSPEMVCSEGVSRDEQQGEGR